MKNIITIVLLIMLVVVAGLMMWEARNGFPTKKHTRIKIPPQLRSGQIIQKYL